MGAEEARRSGAGAHQGLGGLEFAYNQGGI